METKLIGNVQMLARTSQTIGRRAFSTTRAMRSGHYPEGPGTNIPFNPKTRFFFARYWGFMGELLQAGRALSVEELAWLTHLHRNRLPRSIRYCL